MWKNSWHIFIRDMKTNTRDALTLLIAVFPLLFAVGINLIVPGINDTTVNVAMIQNEDRERAEFFEQFANVESLNDKQAVEERVGRRDSVFGVLREDGKTVILAQGDESESLVDYAKLINVLFESGVLLKDARSEIVAFGRTSPPLKQIMVNVLLLFTTVMAGMLIALNILEEKTDQTVKAINVTPTARSAFILGKSLTGMLFALLLSALSLIVTGFYHINIGQAILVLVSLTVLSMIIGFVQGLGSSDVMEAAGSVKLMFLPLIGSVLGYELLSDKWQIFFYWSPFYWAYRANDLILSKSGTWLTLLLYTGLILLICAVVYALLSSRIKKGLQ